MTAYDRETVQVIEYRWLLRLPAHHTDLAQAFSHASHHWEERREESPSDLMITSEDDHLVIFYTVRTLGTFVPRKVGGGTAVPKEFLVEGRTAESC